VTPLRACRAFVGLGSNLGDRAHTLRSAVTSLAALEDTTFIQCSSFLETRALPPARKPFINAAAELATDLDPETLMSALVAIEETHGRKREHDQGDRTLDLDLLLFFRDDAQVRMSSDTLVLPHPELTRRDFVLLPLYELAPDLEVTPGRTAAQLATRFPPKDSTILRIIAPPPT
jgi:2-amino-4-hydroxy-6-hydroxymethyldihydropteridine diphosphokinase